MTRRAVVRSVAHSVPEKVLTNADLEKMVDTSDEWIAQRTGIRERRIARPDEPCSKFCTEAGRLAIERAGLDPMDLDLVIVGTVSGDMPFPATSCLVQENLGAKHAAAFDVGAACAGFIYALSVAGAMLETGQVRRALVIGADMLSKYLDWTDRSTCVLFGDGAGAVVLDAEAGDRGLLKTVLFADGAGAGHIDLKAGGSLHPFTDPATEGISRTVSMNGREVYRFAVHAMVDACCRAVTEAGLEMRDVDLFVPHQANLRIIESAGERLGLPPERVFVNVHKYGNTSAGSIPIGLSEAVDQGRLQPGMVVMTVGFGAGLVWGANVIRW